MIPECSVEGQASRSDARYLCLWWGRDAIFDLLKNIRSDEFLLDWSSMLQRETERPHRWCWLRRDRVSSVSIKRVQWLNICRTQGDLVPPDWSSRRHWDIEYPWSILYSIEYSTLLASARRGNSERWGNKSKYWVTLLIVNASARYWISSGLILFLCIVNVRRNWETLRTRLRELRKTDCDVTRLFFNISANCFTRHPSISSRLRSNVVIV